MDPTACLASILKLAERILRHSDDCLDFEADSVDAVELAERVQALDSWIKRGGFLPEQWSRKP